MTDTTDMQGLIGALKNQSQCDEDGVMCIVSRQAVDEAIDALECQHSQQAQGETREVVAYRTIDEDGYPVTDWISGAPSSDEAPISPGVRFQTAWSLPLAPAAVLEGYTLVPDSALRWLFGEEGTFEPSPNMLDWHKKVYGELGSYWWRTEFRNRMHTAPTPAEPDHIADVNKKVEEESGENHG